MSPAPFRPWCPLCRTARGTYRTSAPGSRRCTRCNLYLYPLPANNRPPADEHDDDDDLRQLEEALT